MQMDVRETKIQGCFEIQPNVFRDERGTFVKTFQREVFAASGLETQFAEEYYSSSRKGVLRGLHFQLPPLDHVKLIYCVSGIVLDAVVDLRAGSPTYGRHEIFEVSAEKGNMIYIPKGLAHGFYVKSDEAVMMYKVTTPYSKEHDTGIHWNSAGIPWPDENPVISRRDSQFINLANFRTPFVFD